MIFRYLSELTQINIDQIYTFLILVIISPVCGFITIRLPQRISQLFNISLGFYYLSIVLGYIQIHQLIQTLISYSLIKYGLRHKNKQYNVLTDKVFIFNMVYLIIMNIRRYVYYSEEWGVDITNVMMIALTKITSFNISYQDGFRDIDSLIKTSSETEDIIDQNIRKISELPSLLDFIEYVYFFPAILVGPFYDYHDFRSMKTRKQIPKLPILKIVELYICALFFFMMIIVVEQYTNYSHELVLTDEFMNYSVLNKIWIIMTFGNHYSKFRYYGGFKAVEIAVITSSLNYNDSSQQYDQFRICTFSDVELNHNPKEIANNWNISIANWLKKYVYLRISSMQQLKDKPSLAGRATLLTFMISALWHGVHPGYYIFFYMFASLQIISKNCYRNRNLFQWIPRFIQITICFGFNFMLICYFGYAFTFLTYTKTIRFFNNFGYWPIYLMNSVLIITSQLNIINPKQKQKQK